jgi:protein-S-isoprenylcysteine O-methyltransferase Ste14
MTTIVVMLRLISLLAFVGPMLLGAGRRGGVPRTGTGRRQSGRATVWVNLGTVGLLLLSLLVISGSATGPEALPLASLGSLLAVAGAALTLRSRRELGPAWSLVPEAGQETGLITTGPHRLVRHPIYLGLSLVGVGEGLAFNNWPAVLIVLTGVVPTFAWRARVEKALLSRTFGERHALYREQTKMIIPYLL